jgi:predicted aspartyl protease
MVGGSMTRVVIPFKDAPTLFVQVVGKNGKRRELRGIVDPAAQYVIIPKVDALHLGYEPAYREMMIGLTEESGFLLAYTIAGPIEAVEITIDEIRVGDLVVKNVAALPHDLPMETGVDVILGHSFLSKLKAVVIDYEKKQLVLEDSSQQQTEAKEKKEGAA